MENETYDKVNKAWKRTCEILLGDEIGELKEYEKYLSKYSVGIDLVINKSALSGMDVERFASKEFCKNARFIRYDERDKYDKMLQDKKISINKLKDLDSVVEAVSENFYYTGSGVLGNSKNVIYSTQIVNSFYIYKSVFVSDSKYAAYCNSVRNGEYTFGGTGTDPKFCINNWYTLKINRCMENVMILNSSDCYFSANIEGCQHIMFSFNQKSKRYMIGNNQLSKDKYQQIKKKLIEDIKTTLKSKKSILSIPEIRGGTHE